MRRRLGRVPARARLRDAAAGGALARRQDARAIPRLVRRDGSGNPQEYVFTSLRRRESEEAHGGAASTIRFMALFADFNGS